MKWIIPPECQGQIVETSYAATIDYALRRDYDQSDRTTQYYIAPWEGWDDPEVEWDPINVEPSAEWQPILAERFAELERAEDDSRRWVVASCRVIAIHVQHVDGVSRLESQEL